MIEVTCPKCGGVFRCDMPTAEINYIAVCPYCAARCRINPARTSNQINSGNSKYNFFITKKGKFLIGATAAILIIVSIAYCSKKEPSPAATSPAAPTTEAAKPSDTVLPTVTPTEVPTSAPQMSNEDIANAISEEKSKIEKESYEAINYEALARYPDEHKLAAVTFSGKVVQVIEDPAVLSDGYGLNEYRIAVNGDYDKIVYVRCNATKNEPRILTDDNVQVYGLSCGLYSYNSLIGNVTLPLIEAQTIEIR